MAALTAAMAALSRSFVEDGILADLPPDAPAPKLKRNVCVAEVGPHVAGRKLLDGVNDTEVPSRQSSSRIDTQLRLNAMVHSFRGVCEAGAGCCG